MAERHRPGSLTIRCAVLGMVLPGGRKTEQMMFFLQVFTAQKDICRLLLAWDPDIQPSPHNNMQFVFRKPNVLLAEFEQNLFKHKHWPSTS